MRALPFHHEELVPLFRALELSPDAVFVTDRRNRIVFWNDAARRLLGFTEDEAFGADCDELLSGCDHYGNRYCSENCPVMRMANRGQIVRNFALTFRGKDRNNLSASVSLLQLRTGTADDYFLLHLLRPEGPEEERPASDRDTPPRPRLVAARESDDVRAQKLTPREVEVLAMIAAGRTTPEIAERLHISQLTARSHIQNILEKLEVHSKAEAVAFAFQKNLI
ncbi:MAG TPA: LuxR C-terminal-related transcriptional regulator [Thermoanaerobaculia bacterium]|nr:LuxR C-terminal-related transcriptional regulator [Thermoanaerobaculia bacterium]